MPQTSSYLPSVVALGLVLFASALLTASRPRLRAAVRTSRRFFIVAALVIAAQSVHFLEELLFGFASRFPAAFGLGPIDQSTFVAFNGAWIAVWLVSLLAVRAGIVIALWPLWFLALAAVLNLIAHPLLALRAGGYFPGLLSAPLLGLLGILTLRELIALTAPDDSVC